MWSIAPRRRSWRGAIPHSFLHVGRSDIDLPDDVDPYDSRIYRRAREALDELLAEGTLLRGLDAGLFLYRQVMDGRAQTGVVGCVHVDDYERDSSASTRRPGRTRKTTAPGTSSR